MIIALLVHKDHPLWDAFRNGIWAEALAAHRVQEACEALMNGR